VPVNIPNPSIMHSEGPVRGKNGNQKQLGSHVSLNCVSEYCYFWRQKIGLDRPLS